VRGQEIPWITEEAWEAMGVMYGCFITLDELAILDTYAVKNVMTTEEAAKAILREAMKNGKPPSKLPKYLGGNAPMLDMMMPRPIHRFIEEIGKVLNIPWHEQSRIVRGYILDTKEVGE